METLTLKPIATVSGTIQIPGSKSLSNRILLLAALARGTTTISNLLDSDDIRHNLNALHALGVQFELSQDKTNCKVLGNDGAFYHNNLIELFLGNAGTAMRPLTAALTLGTGTYRLTGEPRMEERPIEDLVNSLIQCGADIDYLKNPGYPPLDIHAKGLSGGSVTIKGNISSQFLTAMLMATPLAKEDTVIHVDGELVSKPYIDITLSVMEKFGVGVKNNNYQSFHIKGNQSYISPGNIMVEGDASSASYFLAASAISSGKVKVMGTGTNSVQGDVRFAEVLEKMGAKVVYSGDWIQVEGMGGLVGIDVDLNHIPDAAMTIATTALFAQGKTTIRNIYNWRVKETDRLAAMATELRKVGAEVTEGEDYIEITPPKVIRQASIDTYDDHRMAMCFSLAAFGTSKITINDPGCVSKTYPDYFSALASISSYQ